MADTEFIHNPCVQHNLVLSSGQTAFYKGNKTMLGVGLINPFNLHRAVPEDLIPQVPCI
ncbi:hypothetical protein D3C81_2237380 [compost metagenome]